MNKANARHRSRDGKTPTSALLLRSPLEFIAEDHLRLRTMCAEMDRMAHAKILNVDDVSCLRDYLMHELPALLADEDNDLMPLVEARAEPDDEIVRLIERLSEEHAHIDVLINRVLPLLDGAALGGSVSRVLSGALLSLAGLTRRHLILENAILLPLARVRLTEVDFERLRDAMIKRRGLEGLFAE